jgi:hypothetical protein
MEVPYHEAPDATAGVQCSVEGCDAVFNTTDPATHGAFTANCGHSLCGTCADVLVRDADLSPRCPLCFLCKPTVRANPASGLSKQGDMVLANARAGTAAGLSTAAAQEGGEEQKRACVTCGGDGVSTALTRECPKCEQPLCTDDAPAPAKKRKHIVDSLKRDAFDPAAARVAVSNCSSHPMSRVDMFCVDCCEAMCANRAFDGHQRQWHTVTGIEEVTDLAPKVRSFLKAAHERAVSADVSVADVAAARTSLGGCGQRVVAKVSASTARPLR